MFLRPCCIHVKGMVGGCAAQMVENYLCTFCHSNKVCPYELNSSIFQIPIYLSWYNCPYTFSGTNVHIPFMVQILIYLSLYKSSYTCHSTNVHVPFMVQMPKNLSLYKCPYTFHCTNAHIPVMVQMPIYISWYKCPYTFHDELQCSCCQNKTHTMKNERKGPFFIVDNRI